MTLISKYFSENQNALPQISYPDLASLGFLYQQREGGRPSDDEYQISCGP